MYCNLTPQQRKIDLSASNWAHLESTCNLELSSTLERLQWKKRIQRILLLIWTVNNGTVGTRLRRHVLQQIPGGSKGDPLRLLLLSRRSGQSPGTGGFGDFKVASDLVPRLYLVTKNMKALYFLCGASKLGFLLFWAFWRQLVQPHSPCWFGHAPPAAGSQCVLVELPGP